MKKKELKNINLKEIKNPDFLSELNYAELDLLSKNITEYIIDCTAKNGGHLSSNLGAVDATIALCRCFDFSKDKIIFDVGHQCYTYKVLTGRSLDNLRQKDGVSGFQRVNESPYDHFEAGHSSTSISVANGMAIARDLNNEKYDVVAFIGDSSIGNGLSFEGLNLASQNRHKIIIVLNDNGLSIGKPVGGLSKVFRKFSTSSFYTGSKRFYRKVMFSTKPGLKIYNFNTRVKNWFKRHLMRMSIFDILGYSVIGPVDGHNIKAMEKAIDKAKKVDNSVVIYLKTLKGKGYKYAENDKTGIWHGVSGFDKETGVIPNHGALVSWSEIYKDGILKRMRDDDNAITIVPATGLGSALNDVFEEFPTRTIDVGISEEHAMTMAGGLSISGKHPIISIYSTFLQRTYDQISHDIARVGNGLSATILIDRSGLVGNDGNTHQGLYDESILMSIPNTVVAMASTPEQAFGLIEETKNNHGVFCIRFPRDFVMPTKEIERIPFGTWKKERQGKGTAIVSVGPETENVKKLVSENNLDVTIYNAIYQKPLDLNSIKELLSYNKVIVYNCYATETGFANSLCSELANHNPKGKVSLHKHLWF